MLFIPDVVRTGRIEFKDCNLENYIVIANYRVYKYLYFVELAVKNNHNLPGEDLYLFDMIRNLTVGEAEENPHIIDMLNERITFYGL